MMDAAARALYHVAEPGAQAPTGAADEAGSLLSL